TRYTRDFEEFGILGKGGYGTVFRCKHNLDGRHYAIKKIPLGPTRMRKIQENGQAELDHILVEVRTLARLEHPNIVRYHSGWIDTNQQRHTSSSPSLALHIQMSLYSMTLSDFLAPTTYPIASDHISSLRHCFHAHSSLEILSSIIEGVEYLHSEGIVHRDLKPGNIFLAIREGSKPPPGALSLHNCCSCAGQNIPRPFNISICIGDFGLVSAIARPEDTPPLVGASCKAVGTEIYRPYTVTRDNSPSLDVYALGIIAFELLHPFGTRMERHEMLHELKKGRLPDGL
ncbi:kinase-like protein, partial [Aureobasidium namibiae CBS 147.97]